MSGNRFLAASGGTVSGFVLTPVIPALFKDYQVYEVEFQTQRLGWGIDALFLVCSSTQRCQRKLVIQTELSFQATASSEDCKETFQRFRKDFKEIEVFRL